MSPLTIQDQNDALFSRPAKTIQKALQAIVAVKLLGSFEHQGRTYLFQPDWQDYQKITFPRRTIDPPAPAPYCTRATQWLMSHHPGGKDIRTWKGPESFVPQSLTDFPNTSEVIPKDFPLAVSPSRKPLAIAVAKGEDGAARPTPQDLVARWNALRKPGPRVDTLTKERQTTYAKALETHPTIAEWETVIRWLNRQSWANAPGTGSHPNWRATLDWLAKPGKLAEKLDLARAEGDRSAPHTSDLTRKLQQANDDFDRLVNG